MTKVPKALAQDPDSLHEQLERDCDTMARFALDAGLSLPGSVARALGTVRAAGSRDGDAAAADDAKATDLSTMRLARVHETLCRVIDPATPRSIRFLERELHKGGFLGFLGPVPLIRRMMLVSIVLLAGLVATSLSPDVNAETVKLGVLNSSGRVLLQNLLFLISAAGLGATFSALFRANHYVSQNTFDPKYESTYWVRFTLGLIAGIILAELIPLGEAAESRTITKPTLAILGGFSSDVVYRALTRLVETVDTLVRGRNKELVEARDLAARVRHQQMLADGKTKLAADLMHLRRRVGAKVDPKEIIEKLDHILADVAVSDLADEHASAGGPDAADKAS